MNIWLKLSVLLSATTLYSINVNAAEADHYTIPSENVIDITEQLNQYANITVKEHLKNFNETHDCDNSIKSEEALYEELQKIFANHTTGSLVKELLHGHSIPVTFIPLKQSVYADWQLFDGMLLGKKGAENSPLALSPLTKVNNEVIGVDKLEHMFGMGFRYFKQHYIKGKKITKVLKGGIAKEKTILGGNILATGVFSYADLSANFNGMRFWNHMLQKRDDILGIENNAGPYIVCKDNKWTQNPAKPIRFENYIDPSFNESINCSKFATKRGLRSFVKVAKEKNQAISELGNICPLSNELSEQMRIKYNMPIENSVHGIDHWIINSKGHDTVNYFNEF